MKMLIDIKMIKREYCRSRWWRKSHTNMISQTYCKLDVGLHIHTGRHTLHPQTPPSAPTDEDECDENESWAKLGEKSLWYPCSSFDLLWWLFYKPVVFLFLLSERNWLSTALSAKASPTRLIHDTCNVAHHATTNQCVFIAQTFFVNEHPHLHHTNSYLKHGHAVQNVFDHLDRLANRNQMAVELIIQLVCAVDLRQDRHLQHNHIVIGNPLEEHPTCRQI